jgi:hypothetical protein
MGGGGAGSGGSSNNERVRNVLGEAGGASLRRSGARAVTEEGEDIVLTRGGQITTSSGSPMYPMGHGGTQGDQSTSSGDRQRAGWGPEDEDVWGTEEDGAPAVIG